MLGQRHHLRAPTQRRGFTIVELLVAMALIIFIMMILTTAFQQGLDSFRNLKAMGDMQDRLRGTVTVLRDDLAWPHFASPNSAATNAQYLSGQDLRYADSTWTPPSDGYFRILNANFAGSTVPFSLDGTDNDGLMYGRATQHALQFTVLRQGTGSDHMFRTRDFLRQTTPPTIPPTLPPWLTNPFPNLFVDPQTYREQENTGNGTGVFTTRWAEVAYFLAPNGQSANGVPLYSLYRRQKLIMPRAGVGESLSGNDVRVVVADTTLPPGQLPPPSPDISTHTELFLGSPSIASYRQLYNRAGSVSPIFPAAVTQPRFRFGMLPAHNNVTPSNNVTYANLAGLFTPPGQLPIVAPNPLTPAQITAALPGFPQGNYPRLADELGSLNSQAMDDLLLQDVVSFEVKALWDYDLAVHAQTGSSPPPLPAYNMPGFAGNPITNSDYPFDFLPASGTNLALATRGLRVFDTWHSSTNVNSEPYSWVENPAAPAGSQQRKPMWQRTDYPVVIGGVPTSNPDWTAARVPLRIRIKSLQIRIRVWDFKTEQTRQITFIQDM